MLKIYPPIFIYLAGFLSAMFWVKGWYTEQVLIGVVMCILAFSVHSITILKRDSLRLPLSSVLYIAAAFWALALISIFLSDLPFEAFIKFGLFSAMPISFLFVALTPKDDIETFIKFLLIGMVGIGTTLAIGALIQYIFLPEMLFRGLTHYPFNNPNSLAAFLSLNFFVSSGFWLLKPQNFIRLALPALFFLAIATTGGRGAMLFLTLMSIPLILLTSSNISLGNKLKRLGLFFAMIVVLFLSLDVIPKAERDSLITPSIVLDKTLGGHQSLLSQRGMIWNSAWQVIQNNPIKGVGIGNFHYYYHLYRDPADTSSGFHAHSDPLQFWAELGILAPFLFYGFIVFGAYRTILAVQKTRPDQIEQRVKILAPFCALGAMIAHSHFSFNMQFISILMFGGVLLGIWYIHSAQALEEKPSALRPPKWIPASIKPYMLALPCFVFLVLYAPAMSSYGTHKLAGEALRRGDIERYQHYNDLTETLSLGMNARAYISRADLPLTILHAMPQMNRDQKLQLIQEARGYIDRAREINPLLRDTIIRERKYQEIIKREGLR